MGSLTDVAIQKTQANGSNDAWLSDGGARGSGMLVVRIKPGGGRTFYFRYTFEGKRTHIRIGPYNQRGDGQATFTLRQARARLSALREAHSGHGDVRGHLQAEKRRAAENRRIEAEQAAEEARLAGIQSFGSLLHAYVHGLEKAGKQSTREVSSAIRRHVLEAWPTLCDKRASDITPPDIRAILKLVADKGKLREADKLRAYLRAAFAASIKAQYDPTACGSDFAIDTNPAAAIARIDGANQRGNRHLSADELRAFWHELDQATPILRDAVRLSVLLGGQRFAQLLRARPEYVDLQARTILLLDGKGRRKSPRPHLLPITESALEVLARLLKINGGAPFVMSTDGRSPIHDSTISALVHYIAKRMFAAGTARAMFRGGDLRRTCETMLAAIGISSDVRAQIQSHGLGGVQAAHYDRHGYMEEKRAALEAWERRLVSIITGEPEQTNVVQINRAA